MTPPLPPLRNPRWPANLMLRGGKFYVQVRVPESLRGVVSAGRGTHIRRSLNTGNEAEAIRRHRHVEAEIKKVIEAARREPDGSPKGSDPSSPDIAAQAAWWRPVLKAAAADTEDPAHIVFGETVDRMLGAPVGDFIDGEGIHHPLYDDEREARTSEFFDLATGRRVPVAAELERFLQNKRGKTGEPLSTRYISRIKRAVRDLGAWLALRPEGDNLAMVTRYVAGRYAEHLGETCPTAQTASSLLTALSSYWRWMVRRGVIEENPWTDQSPETKASSGDAEKRPFTDAEITKLLTGDTYSTLHDMMRIAALSGMRINEIGRLTVADCQDGSFNIRKAKTKAGVRRVPIHSALTPLVARRVVGKRLDQFLIEELAARKDHTSDRAGKASERFTAYRRALGIEPAKPGQRQADADFHSFRRWFITKAEQAGQPESTIQAVVGQKRPSLAFGTYSGGPSDPQFTAVVESVRLPEGTPADKPEGSRMGDGRWPPRRTSGG